MREALNIAEVTSPPGSTGDENMIGSEETNGNQILSSLGAAVCGREPDRRQDNLFLPGYDPVQRYVTFRWIAVMACMGILGVIAFNAVLFFQSSLGRLLAQHRLHDPAPHLPACVRRPDSAPEVRHPPAIGSF